MICPKCRREIFNEDAIYCPFCSKPLDNLPPAKHSSFLVASGILTIIGSCFALIIGLFLSIGGSYSLRYGGETELIAGFFGISAFASGLAAGILLLKKNSFRSVIIGEVWLLLVTLVLGASIPLYGLFIIFGYPVIALSVLGVIFAAVGKSSFNY